METIISAGVKAFIDYAVKNPQQKASIRKYIVKWCGALLAVYSDDETLMNDVKKAVSKNVTKKV